LINKEKYIDQSEILDFDEHEKPVNFYDQNPMSFQAKGGSHQAHDLLETFLESRGENYQREMSSPITG
jgi:hypothetical protein